MHTLNHIHARAYTLSVSTKFSLGDTASKNDKTTSLLQRVWPTRDYQSRRRRPTGEKDEGSRGTLEREGGREGRGGSNQPIAHSSSIGSAAEENSAVIERGAHIRNYHCPPKKVPPSLLIVYVSN